jgi:cell wall-associated NlpC family hydrolase
LINFNKTVVPVFLLCFAVFASTANAQVRDRVVKPTSSQPTNQPNTQPVERVRPTVSSRPTLTNEIKVVRSADPAWEPKVKKTVSASATSAAGMAAAGRTTYNAATSVRLDQAIKSRYGIPYRYGSTGPNRYDCSGFVWSAFQEAGINFTRQSARSLWSQSEPVFGDDRYKFGTLVFLNGLGHMGIVADENGFYHASSSKGITYSPFAGYWSNRIVGFRRLKVVDSASVEKPRVRFQDENDR